MLNIVSLPRKLPPIQQTRNKNPEQELYLNPKSNQPSDKTTAFQGFEHAKKNSYNEIYSHELAHKQAGGDLAGSISINTDSKGMAVSGNVPIQLPRINETRPEESISKAQKVYSAALAPSDPSGQDYMVAAAAQAILGQAQVAMNGKLNGNVGSADKNPKVTGNANINQTKKLNFFA